MRPSSEILSDHQSQCFQDIPCVGYMYSFIVVGLWLWQVILWAKLARSTAACKVLPSLFANVLMGRVIFQWLYEILEIEEWARLSMGHAPGVGRLEEGSKMTLVRAVIISAERDYKNHWKMSQLLSSLANASRLVTGFLSPMAHVWFSIWCTCSALQGL